jgi:uncharacterized protein with PQ loop repeat
MRVIEFFPTIGLLIMTCGFATQLVRVLRSRQVAGISPAGLVQVLICSMLFSIYYAGLGHFVALGLNFLFSAIVVALLLCCRAWRHRT